jgi:putative PIN family toxin of toxin-antitoxin system
MRVVLDTNIFVSAALKASSWPGSVVRWVDRNGTLLQSEATAAEIIEVLQRPRFASVIPSLYVDNIRRMLGAAELVPITERVTVCRDPKDDRFLEVAINGRADVVVTGDADLLALVAFRGILIVDPATFGRSQIV